jgi:hypothetical protein
MIAEPDKAFPKELPGALLAPKKLVFKIGVNLYHAGGFQTVSDNNP